MEKHIVEGPSKNSFEESFEMLDRALEKFEEIPLAAEEESLNWSLDEGISRMLSEKNIMARLSFHQCMIAAIEQSLSAGEAYRHLHRSLVKSPPAASQVLLRTMLLGAAKVCYVYLGNGPNAMTQRSIDLLSTEFKYANQAANSFAKYDHYPDLDIGQEARKQLKAANKLFQEIGNPPSETALLRAAAGAVQDQMAATIPNFSRIGRVLEQQIGYTWSFASANAHCLGWPMVFGANSSGSPGSPVDDFYNAAMLAYCSVDFLRQAGTKQPE